MNLKHKPTHTRPAFLNPANSASRFRFSALVFLVPAMLLLGFAGWRVNYDTVLLALCSLVDAPPGRKMKVSGTAHEHDPISSAPGVPGRRSVAELQRREHGRRRIV